MSYNVILDKLIVGDYEAAKNLHLLEHLGVTHIVACGFDKGYFHRLRKFHYFCIDIIDAPFSNLLQYLPRAVKFIEKAIIAHTVDHGTHHSISTEGEGRGGGVVFVHCVHGQSRSCAVCVAYLMQQVIQSQSLDILHQKNITTTTTTTNMITNDQESFNDKKHETILHLCYEKVLKSRSQMAINPGFVKQLEIFRRMKLIQLQKHLATSTTVPTLTSTVLGPMMILSKSHAYFRSFRAKTQYQDCGNVKSQFCPLMMIDNTSNSNQTIGNDITSNYNIYHCLNCQTVLFTEMNIIQELSEEEISSLPVSDYWKDSQGGIDYYHNMNKSSSSRSDMDQYFESVLKRPNEVIKIEPLEWMRTFILCNETYVSKGNLVCHKCSNQLGYWDWLNSFDVPTVVLIKRTKVFIK